MCCNLRPRPTEFGELRAARLARVRHHVCMMADAERSTADTHDERAELTSYSHAHRHTYPRLQSIRQKAKAIAALTFAAALLYLSVVLLEADGRSPQVHRRPQQVHILLFEADQVRPDAHELGRGSASRIAAPTPNLDRIAKEGVRFANAYSSTPICTPARLAILTGHWIEV